MIARIWRGRAAAEKADNYYHHFATDVVGNLKNMDGCKGGYLLRRPTEGDVEFLAVTFWDSIDAIKRFSGDDPEVAHIEPEGRAALSEFDEFSQNYEIVCNTLDRP